MDNSGSARHDDAVLKRKHAVHPACQLEVMGGDQDGDAGLAGEVDEAIAWLEESYRQRNPLMVSVKGQPSLDPLRADPRFDDLVRRIGYPES
ncbi:MAG: hypothetical protein IIC08_06705 [Proteobacteria bacterium]|nr:hypothetical protein [Pseudomonadota bacterium]